MKYQKEMAHVLQRIVEEFRSPEVAAEMITKVLYAKHTDASFSDNMCILHGLLNALDVEDSEEYRDAATQTGMYDWD